jgi:hypothetical protein
MGIDDEVWSRQLNCQRAVPVVSVQRSLFVVTRRRRLVALLQVVWARVTDIVIKTILSIEATVNAAQALMTAR